MKKHPEESTPRMDNGMYRAGTHSRMLIRLSALVLFTVVWLGAKPTSAACSSPADTLWLLSHSRLASGAWGEALAQTVAVISESVCALRVDRVEMVGEGNVNRAVFSADGQLYATTATWTPPFCPSGAALLAVDEAVLLDVPYAAGRPFYAVDHPSYRDDSLLVVVADSSMRLVFYLVRAADGTRLGTDTIPLVPTAPSQEIGTIVGDPGITDTALWVVGSGGLVRRIVFGAGGWSTPESLDTDPTRTISAIGEGFAAGEDGTIFWIDSALGLVRLAQPTDRAVRAISSRGAVGDDGLVIVRSGAEWQVFTAGTADYRSFRPTKDRLGSAFGLLDSAGRYTLFAYDDQLTRIGSTIPWIVPNDEEPYLIGNGGATTVRVVLADADSNFSTPSIFVRKLGHPAGQEGVSLTVNDRGDTLRSREPGGPCRIGSIHLESPLMDLTFDGGWVELSVGAVDGAYDFTCSGCYRSSYQFRAGAGWSKGDTLVVAAGPDTLRMVADDVGVGAAPAAFGHRFEQSTWHPGAVVLPGGRLVVRMGAEVTKAEVYTVSGRFLGRLSGTRGSTIAELDGRIPGGVVLCVRYLLRDGAAMSCVVPVVR